MIRITISRVSPDNSGLFIRYQGRIPAKAARYPMIKPGWNPANCASGFFKTVTINSLLVETLVYSGYFIYSMKKKKNVQYTVHSYSGEYKDPLLQTYFVTGEER